ncbi:hypothetical protein M9434_004781 [Picochlorum sp. BPE23]|nr:hypothetical protein M9434_004781 [Picochlorum sp. BPE23]
MHQLEHESIKRGDSSLEFIPDQVHVSLWTETDLMVSFATGLGRIGSDTVNPPPQYSEDACGDSLVQYWETDSDAVYLARESNDRVVYSYAYSAPNGPWVVDGDTTTGTVYTSPILHHVRLKNLTPGAVYKYTVGTTRCGMSDKIYSVKIPDSGPSYPFKIAVVSDLGQTMNSSLAVDRMKAFEPDMVVLSGDLSYADAYYANGSFYYWNDTVPLDYFKSFQPRWDTFGRLMEPLISEHVFASIGGNHELESQRLNRNLTDMAYNARYPNPQFPETPGVGHAVQPNDPSQYWDQTQLPQRGIFLPEDLSNTAVTNNSFYSINAGPVHMIFLNNYVPYGKGSVMYRWLEKDLQGVNPSQTPWIIVAFHTPWYSTYMGSYKENAEMQHMMEPLFRQYNVDLVISGHVHAYDRSVPVFDNKVDSCGIVHIVLGSGNAEGLTQGYIDDTEYTYSKVKVSDLCREPERYFATPGYQPTYTGRGHIDNGPFCYDSQAPWSDYREPSFGHGTMTLLNDTALEWRWNRNIDPSDAFLDRVIIVRKNTSSSGSGCTSKVVAGTTPSAHSDAKPYRGHAALDLVDSVYHYLQQKTAHHLYPIFHS